MRRRFLADKYAITRENNRGLANESIVFHIRKTRSGVCVTFLRDGPVVVAEENAHHGER